MKRVLVTGASKGIGQAISQKLLDQGVEVIGTSREPERINLKKPGFTAVHLDLFKIAEDSNVLEQFAKQCADIDAIVFNAGMGRFGGLEEFSHEQINHCMSVNLVAQIQLARAFIQQFKHRSGGDFIFVGSESALSGARAGSIYCAAKFGLRGFTQALRAECSSKNIRVGLINPGMVQSSFFDDLSFCPGPEEANKIMPQQVADAVMLMLNSAGNVVWDEINLSPLKKVVQKKKNY